MSDGGMLCSSTRLAIWCWKSNLTSITARLGISDLPVVCMHLTNPILRKRLWVHIDEIRSIHSKCSSVLFSISACAIAMTTTEFTTPALVLTPCCRLTKLWVESFELSNDSACTMDGAVGCRMTVSCVLIHTLSSNLLLLTMVRTRSQLENLSKDELIDEFLSR